MTNEHVSAISLLPEGDEVYNPAALRPFLVENCQYASRVMLDNDIRVIGIQHLTSRQVEEDHALIGVLYRVVHYKHGSKELMVGGNDKYKRQKKDYDRIFEFCGLSGGVFSMIFDSPMVARSAIGFLGERIAVGRVFVVVAPSLVERSNYKVDMPVVSSAQPLLPFEDTFIKYFPPIKIANSDIPAKDYFFVYHGIVNLRLINVRLIHKGDPVKPSCCGYFCDRQGLFNINGACGCFDYEIIKHSGIVLMYNVDFSIDGTDGKPKTVLVNDTRSLRTSRLFGEGIEQVAGESKDVRTTEERIIKRHVKSCVNYINNHGGFTIMGYITTGNIVDNSDEVGSSKIQSIEPTTHIIYLYPTDHNIVGMDEYVSLKYKYILPEDRARSNRAARAEEQS
jgi:hypothetical protein